MPSLSMEHVSELSRDLVNNDSLVLPAKLAKDGCTDNEKQSYLSALLQHDPGVFLERHGKLISEKQREYFQPLRGDYEVNFYLMLLEDQEKDDSGKPQGKSTVNNDTPAVSTKAKNRRLAKMARLDKQGYFDEEASRKRAPLLHHQYLGQYAPPRAPISANTLSDHILQQHEERQIAETMAQQQVAEDRAGEAFEATLSESESDTSEEGDEEMAVAVKPGHERDYNSAQPISHEELAENKEDFRALMQARFLSGKDGGAEADADSELDNDWEKERRQDQEDQYFEC